MKIYFFLRPPRRTRLSFFSRGLIRKKNADQPLERNKKICGSFLLNQREKKFTSAAEGDLFFCAQRSKAAKGNRKQSFAALPEKPFCTGKKSP